LRGDLDCFVALLLAMTKEKRRLLSKARQLRRQGGYAHQEGVDRAGGLAAFTNRPDHERLAAAGVARSAIYPDT
jgi:hypothetical protein